jgi:hypothetical protein
MNEKQRLLLYYFSQEKVKRLEADAKRLEDLKERKLERQERANWFKEWWQNQKVGIVILPSDYKVTHPKYIISSDPSKREMNNT